MEQVWSRFGLSLEGVGVSKLMSKVFSHVRLLSIYVGLASLVSLVTLEKVCSKFGVSLD